MLIVEPYKVCCKYAVPRTHSYHNFFNKNGFKKFLKMLHLYGFTLLENLSLYLLMTNFPNECNSIPIFICENCWEVESDRLFVIVHRLVYRYFICC